MSNLDQYIKKIQATNKLLSHLEQTKLLENMYQASLYQSLVVDRLKTLGFKYSEIRFKVTKKKFLYFFETDQVFVYTEQLTDDIINALKIIE